MTAGVMTPFILASSNTFKISMLIQNAQVRIEDSLDFRPPPLEGNEWPGGDLTPNPKMLLQTWRYNGSHRSGRDPRLAPLTCRLFHVCQYSDGSLLLPEAMRRVERSIRGCGIDNYVFARQAAPTTQFDHSHAMMDLVSPRVPPGDDDPEGQLLHTAQIVFGQHISAEEWSSRTVDYRTYNGSGVLEESRGTSRQHVAKPLTPLLYSSTDVQDIGSVDEEGKPVRMAWGSFALTKLRKSMDGFEMHNIGDAFPGYHAGTLVDPSSSKKPVAICYHSIMSTGEKGDELPRRMMGPSNAFFVRNTILRHTRWLLPTNESGNPGANPAKEDKSIELNPRRSSAIRNDDGFLNLLVIRDRLSKLDVDAIKAGLVSRLKMVNQDSKRALKLSTKVLNASAPSPNMFDAFQVADIVVSAQGAALNNVLFMRARSLVVEIVPYSAPNDVYSRVCDTLSVSYVGFMARADGKSFEKCLNQVDTDSGNTGMGAASLLDAWKKSAYQFQHGDRRSVMDLRSPRSQWRRTVPSAVKCAQNQERLKLVDTESILRAAFDRAVVPRLQ